MPEGLELPPTVLQGLETRGADVTNYLPNKRLTASLLEGAFKFKPRGSVETADRGRQRADFAQSLQAIASLSKANPMIQQVLLQPQVAKALLEKWVYLYNITDKQAFLGSEAMAVLSAPPPMGLAPGAAPVGQGDRMVAGPGPTGSPGLPA